MSRSKSEADTSGPANHSYEALGLVASLNPNFSGGTEQPLGATSERWRSGVDVSMEPQAPSSDLAHGNVPTGYGRIIRDEAGNVVDVQLAEEDADEPAAPSAAPIEDLPDFTQEEQTSPWIGLGSVSRQHGTDTDDTHVVKGECPKKTIVSICKRCSVHLFLLE